MSRMSAYQEPQTVDDTQFPVEQHSVDIDSSVRLCYNKVYTSVSKDYF